MGDPRKLKPKYDMPKRIWNAERIAEEQALKAEYGLKTMRELWIAKKLLKKIRRKARRLLSIGERGQRALVRLMGMILTAIAVQMLLNGIGEFLTSLPGALHGGKA